ncbi:hypothetical protein B0H16DRAFT_383010 [Mycena metata]|uniref:Uncharacterized protein n=1 Tax=Mycena metata TaxID=1033252 RepID=A0AAD7HIN6_9AGAR|nr:hypothetical protein B0H16DRAFT_383010 [Mycena metata]
MIGLTKEAIAKFDINPLRLLDIIQKTNCIIVGAIPMKILSGARFESDNFDLLVPASEEATMKIYMKEAFSYQFKEAKPVFGTNRTVKSMHVFLKGDNRVNLWIAAAENAVVPLMLSHSTVVMNYISAWGIFCAYPKLTLAHRSLINHFVGDEQERNGKEAYRRLVGDYKKYAARGISFGIDATKWADISAHTCYASAYCTHSIRSMYDSGVLFIRFPARTRGKDDLYGSIRYDNKHTVVWSLGGSFCGTPGSYHRAFADSKRIYPNYDLQGFQADE